MIRPPPRSPLFPYTPLFRSLDVHPLREERMGVVLERGGREPLNRVDLRVGNGLGLAAAPDEAGGPDDAQDAQPLDKGKAGRSEEHTSELQSQSNLVCRLLLE